MFHLGPFALYHPLGSGGMGTVWRAIHEREGVEAAVKVLDPGSARADTFRADFRNEVRAVAGLDHPHIVMVLDHGEVTDAEAAGSDGNLSPGMPYLAMERVRGDSLSRRRGRVSWDELRAILLQVLDALAHAHAAGVVHRDIKPGNVLWDGTTAKLVDFGIAHLDTGTTEPAGTPAYMAPEQFSSDWRDLGPSTDLYALGCLAWELCTGQRPFPVRGFEAFREAHLTRVPVPLEPRCTVPVGFEGWCRRLLRKSPWERYQRAADAAWALHSLAEPTASSSLPATLAAPADLATLVLDESMLSSQPTRLFPTDAAQLAAGGRFLAPLPPFPRRWRRSETPRRPLQLLGAGLALFGLRRIPMIGRDAERDALWAGLRATQRDGRPRVLWLQGPSGCGKSRLAAWLGRRAHEVGAASVLTAIHSPDGGAADGVLPMLGRYLRCVGLDAEARIGRLRRLAPSLGIVEPEEVEALSDLIGGAIEHREVRQATFLRLVRRLCEERPQILLLDDIQWGPEALDLVEALLDAGRSGLEVLVVGTVRAEALADVPDAAARIEATLNHEQVTRLPLDALDEADRTELVASLLRLEPDLARRVVRRTAGNPLFAIQLVGDWVQRGLLEHGDSGFRLAPSATDALPDDLHAVWSDRLDRTLSGRSAAHRRALELAAFLGQAVALEEWRAACAEAALPADETLIEHLIESRLARTAMEGGAPGWRFVHAMLRESLIRRATDGGRAEGHHLAAAAGLSAAEVDDPARIGAHLLAGGDPAAAQPHLNTAHHRYRSRGELDRASSMLTQERRALDAMGAPATDPRRAQIRINEGWVLSLGRHTADAVEVFEDALRQSEESGDRLAIEDAEYALGICYKLAGRLEDSRRLLERAVASSELLEHRSRRANALMALASTLAYLGRVEQARPLVEEAHAIHVSMGATRGMISTLFTMAGNAASAGDDARARELSLEGLVLGRGHHDPYSIIAFEGMLGDIARRAGDFDDARGHYRTCREVERRVGRIRAPITELNLALLEVQAGRYDEARPVLERLLVLVEDIGQRGLVGMCELTLLPCLAEAGEWDAFDRTLASATHLLQVTGLVAPDAIVIAELTEAKAAAAGHSERARRVAAVAAAQREALQRP